MISQMIEDMEQYIPRRDGTLSASGTPISDRIRYPGDYARAQFYGSSYNKTKSWTFKSTPRPELANAGTRRRLLNILGVG